MMHRRRIAQAAKGGDLFDRSTGEILEGLPILIPTRVPSPYGDRWMQLHQDPLIAIAQDKKITLQCHRVLMYFNATLDFENWLYSPPSEIAKVLGMHRSNVRAAIRIIEERGIILPGPRVGNTPTYRLNPLFGWKGKIVSLRRELSPGSVGRGAKLQKHTDCP